MESRSKSPRQRPLGNRKVEGELKKAFELIASVFENASDDLNIVFRIENTRDWAVNEVNDVKVEFILNHCNSIGFLEEYFQRKLRDPNCKISFYSEFEKHNFVLNTNYTRILSFYSLKYWLITFCKKNTAWIILFGLLIWYLAMTFYGYYYQNEVLEQKSE
jgi:hypothetical protein